MRLVRYLSEGRLERDDGMPTRLSVGTPYLVFRYLNLRSRLKGRRAEREPFALSRLLDLTWCYPCASHLDKLVRATVYILSDSPILSRQPPNCSVNDPFLGCLSQI